MKNLFLLTLLSLGYSTFAQNPTPPAGPDVKRGPFFSGTIRGQKADETIAMKGIVVTVGQDQKAWVCYDTDLMRISQAWSGEFLEFGNTQQQIAWPPPPQVKGKPLFSTRNGPGWARQGNVTDPRPRKQGPLPKEWTHYKGLYQDGDQVVLKYQVGNVAVLEMPGLVTVSGTPVFTRTLQFQDKAAALTMVLLDGAKPANSQSVGGQPVSVAMEDGSNLSVAISPALPGSSLSVNQAGQLLLQLEKVSAQKPFRVSLAAAPFSPEALGMVLADLRAHCRGGNLLWKETITTQGTLGAGTEGYVVDTLTEPVDNPYFAKTFFGGFDFLPDGRAVICTFHGDVWVVSGIDDSLKKLEWKRFATGLFQPLGVKTVGKDIFVLGRDQLTRLHDLNRDGEADFYENFNNDVIVTPNYHEFSMDLHTDRAGNFYFAKGAPWEPSVTSAHQGCLFKLSKDGSRLEIIATGLRAPNGMTVGPRDEITVSDNQGHWMPSSKLNWVEKGGFYGMIPAAQRQVQFVRGGTNFTMNPSDPDERKKYAFKGWDAETPLPTSFDRPFCWVPMTADNSSGGQLWVTSKKMGPLNDQLLFMSYGKCTVFSVMSDVVDGTRQAAMYQLPLKFKSGVMRGRVNEKDGQVYLCGLKGWQTSATRDGGFYRVRYTGKPALMPVAFHAKQGGVHLTFSLPLDASVEDVENYSAEAWNYVYSGAYGSPEFSPTNPGEKKHDPIEITEARLQPDGKTLFLKFKNAIAADQVKIRYNVKAKGASNSLAQEIFATIYKYGNASGE